MANTPFLADLHGSFALSLEQVVGLAARAAGRDVESVERLARGYDNEVYRVTLTDEHVVFVRIRRHGEGAHDQEAWAMGLARAGGVPVPEILAIDGASEAADGPPVMVIAAATGRQLETVLAGASVRERQQILFGVGEEVARLHSITMPGVWRPGDNGQWPDPHQVRQGFRAERRAESVQLVAADMSVAEVDRVTALLELSPDPPLTGFVLCHGDISAEHVFVDSKHQVSGLIDWGMWHAGSRTGELAYLARTFGWSDLQPILQGYGVDLADGAMELQRQLATVLAVQLIGHIAHHLDIGDADGAASNVAAVRQALHVLDGTSST